MKLQAQYNKISIASSIFVLLIAGAGYYFLLNYVLKDQLDETLRVEQAEIRDFIQNNHSLPPATTYKDQRIEFKRSDRAIPQNFRTLTLYNAEENEKEVFMPLLAEAGPTPGPHTVAVMHRRPKWPAVQPLGNNGHIPLPC